MKVQQLFESEVYRFHVTEAVSKLSKIARDVGAELKADAAKLGIEYAGITPDESSIVLKNGDEQFDIRCFAFNPVKKMDLSKLHPDPEVAKKLAAKMLAKSGTKMTLDQLKANACKEFFSRVADSHPEVKTVGFRFDDKYGTEFKYVPIREIEVDDSGPWYFRLIWSPVLDDESQELLDHVQTLLRDVAFKRRGDFDVTAPKFSGDKRTMSFSIGISNSRLAKERELRGNKNFPFTNIQDEMADEVNAKFRALEKKYSNSKWSVNFGPPKPQYSGGFGMCEISIIN